MFTISAATADESEQKRAVTQRRVVNKTRSEDSIRVKTQVAAPEPDAALCGLMTPGWTWEINSRTSPKIRVVRWNRVTRRILENSDGHYPPPRARDMKSRGSMRLKPVVLVAYTSSCRRVHISQFGTKRAGRVLYMDCREDMMRRRFPA